jgi:hypothetical protein
MKWGLLFTVMSAVGFATAGLADERAQRRAEAVTKRAEAMAVIEGSEQKLFDFVRDNVEGPRRRVARLLAERDPCGVLPIPGIQAIRAGSDMVETKLTEIHDLIVECNDDVGRGDYYFGRGFYGPARDTFDAAKINMSTLDSKYNLLLAVDLPALRNNLDAAEGWLQARLLQCPRDVRPLALDVMSSVVESQTVDDNSSSDGVMSIEP